MKEGGGEEVGEREGDGRKWQINCDFSVLLLSCFADTVPVPPHGRNNERNTSIHYKDIHVKMK